MLKWKKTTILLSEQDELDNLKNINSSGSSKMWAHMGSIKNECIIALIMLITKT